MTRPNLAISRHVSARTGLGFAPIVCNAHHSLRSTGVLMRLDHIAKKAT
jgi:hypothetical protein